MARVSRFKLKDAALEKIFRLFFEVVGRKNNIEDFQKVINDILSPNERVMISKRVAIIYLLLKGIEYNIICDVLKVSPSTVAKFSLLLEKSEGIKEAFQRMLLSDKMSLMINEIFDFIIPPGTYGASWSAAWDRKKDIRREKTRGGL